MTDSKPRAKTSWSASAKRVFREIVDANHPLDPATLAGLYSACDLLADADRMSDSIGTDFVSTGSQGQPVAHPLISEVRLYRTQAQTTLRSLGLTSRSGASAAGAALAGKRWQKPRSGSGATVSSIEQRLSGAK